MDPRRRALRVALGCAALIVGASLWPFVGWRAPAGYGAAWFGLPWPRGLGWFDVASNVVAYLPASGPTTGVTKPWVAIGAHYDHLGRGEAGNSLAEKQDTNQVHHGADDNASGTSAVLAIAEALSKQQRRRNLLVAFWSGEELGLLGSNAFVTKPPVPIEQTKPSTWPSVWRQISGPVVRTCASRLDRLSHWLAYRTPPASERASSAARRSATCT